MYITGFMDGVFATFLLQICILLIVAIVTAWRKVKGNRK